MLIALLKSRTSDRRIPCITVPGISLTSPPFGKIKICRGARHRTDINKRISGTIYSFGPPCVFDSRKNYRYAACAPRGASFAMQRMLTATCLHCRLVCVVQRLLKPRPRHVIATIWIGMTLETADLASGYYNVIYYSFKLYITVF